MVLRSFLRPGMDKNAARMRGNIKSVDAPVETGSKFGEET